MESDQVKWVNENNNANGRGDENSHANGRGDLRDDTGNAALACALPL